MWENNEKLIKFQFLIGNLKSKKITVFTLEFAMFQFLIGNLKSRPLSYN